MRTVIASLLLTLTIIPRALAVDPQPADTARAIEEGTAARDRREWDAADAAYRRALEIATRQDDKEGQYRAWFYIGLVKQVAADVAGDVVSKKALLEQSLEPYQTALALNPKSKSTRINLAEAEWFLGNRERAVALLTEALAVDESPDVAEKLGDAYRALGNRAEAARVYAIAAGKNADSLTVHEKLLMALLGDNYKSPLGPALTEYLWALIQRNQVDRAVGSAAQALAHPELAAEDGRDVLTMFASALARKDYDAATFTGSSAATKINALIASQSPHTPALQALVNAYNGTIGDKTAFEIWADDRPIGSPTAGYPSPIVAFRAVLRSIASASSRQLKQENAIAYYNLALSMDTRRADPGSVRALASIYAAGGDYKSLAKLDEQYQRAMFSPATPEEARDLYEYFRLMGRVQTLRAPATAEGLHWFEQAKTAGAGGIAEPELYEQLSEMYEKRGETEKSNSEKFSAATAYLERGNFQLARSAIADLGHGQPDGVDHGDYKKVVQKLVWLPESIRNAVPSDEHFKIKRNVLLLCAGASKEDRMKAFTELKHLGITINTREQDLYVLRQDGRLLRGHFFLPSAPDENAASEAH
jgi:tetratricopeptide (TPR) repeat protein